MQKNIGSELRSEAASFNNAVLTSPLPSRSRGTIKKLNQKWGHVPISLCPSYILDLEESAKRSVYASMTTLARILSIMALSLLLCGCSEHTDESTSSRSTDYSKQLADILNMSHDFTTSDPMSFEEVLAHYQASFEGKDDPFWTTLTPEEQEESRFKRRTSWEKYFGVYKDDEFRYFRSDEESWTLLGGRAGYAIIRDGMVVETFPTSMN